MAFPSRRSTAFSVKTSNSCTVIRKVEFPELSANNVVSVLEGKTNADTVAQHPYTQARVLVVNPPQNCQPVSKADSEMLPRQVTCHAEIMLAVVHHRLTEISDIIVQSEKAPRNQSPA